MVHAMIDIDPATAQQNHLQATMKALPGVLEVRVCVYLCVSWYTWVTFRERDRETQA